MDAFDHEWAADSDHDRGIVVLAGRGPCWDWILRELGTMRDLRLAAVEQGVDGALSAIEREHPAVVLLCADYATSADARIVEQVATVSPTAAIVVAGSASLIGRLMPHPAVGGVLDTAHLTRRRLRLALLAASSGLLVRTAATTPPRLLPSLTRLEEEVLDGLRRSLTEQEMRREFSVGRTTVARAIESLEGKLGVRGRFMLGAMAAWHGLIAHEQSSRSK